MKKTTPDGIDAYIASCEPAVRPILTRIRATVRKAAPRAEERISYRMPAFFQDGVLIYYAAFKNHIGIYPPVNDKTLKAQLAKYTGPKGNLKFPLDEPFPYGLL
ncbi:MAG: iron chaperone, partial [Rhodospirillaceae bacterium]